MEVKHDNKKNNYFFVIIACIWLIFSCIYIIRSFNESKIYDVLAGDISVSVDTPLGKKIMNIQNALQANQSVQQQEYEQALQLISGTNSKDYYNRWTIQTLLAYQNALQSTISWLQNAQVFIAQAQQSFTIAQKLSNSSTLNDAINNNQATIKALSPVIDIKTCYGIGQAIVSHINDITSTIESIKKTLDQEDADIDKKAWKLDSDCYEKLRSIVDSSKEQAGFLQIQMLENANIYKSDFSDKIENPMMCIQSPYQNILPSIIKGKQWLQEYQQLHQNTIDALQSNDNERIQELCNKTKNDAQINQQIENSVQELLQRLEDNKTENEEKRRSSNETQYKDFFDEDEKKALQEIQQINKWWINNILNIRGKGNYNPKTYINTMFNQFYGNSGDFIDLHK